MMLMTESSNKLSCWMIRFSKMVLTDEKAFKMFSFEVSVMMLITEFTIIVLMDDEVLHDDVDR